MSERRGAALWAVPFSCVSVYGSLKEIQPYRQEVFEAMGILDDVLACGLVSIGQAGGMRHV